MTTPNIEARKSYEWNYHYTERRNMLAPDREPTEAEDALAIKDADAAVTRVQVPAAKVHSHYPGDMRS